MILLTILKIIGICILTVLAILLLVLFVLLFVPVRYRSTGKISKENRQIMAKVSYLASAISAVVQYRDGKLSWAVKVFGIRLLPKENDQKEKKQHRLDQGSRNRKPAAKPGHVEKTTGGQQENEQPPADRTQENGKSSGQTMMNESKSDLPQESEKEIGQTTLKNEKISDLPQENRKPDVRTQRKETSSNSACSADTGAAQTGKENYEPAESKNAGENKSTSIFKRLHQRISHFWERIRERFQNIREQVVRILDRIKTFQTRLQKNGKKAERWEKFYHLEETQTTIRALKSEVKNLIRYLLPTRIRAKIHFGFQDPSDTGITLGAISAVYGFFPKGIDLEPDFEEQVLEGEWTFRGRVRLAYFVRLALRLLLKKENRITYRRFRKLMAQT